MKSPYFYKKNEKHNEQNMSAFKKFIEMTQDFNKIDEIRLFIDEFNNKYHKTTGFKISLNFETIEEEITESAEQKIQEQTEIITEIKEEHLEEFDDDLEMDDDAEGDVLSVMEEMLDKIKLNLENNEVVNTEITEATEEVVQEVITEPPVIINYHCATCNYTGRDNYGLRTKETYE